MKTCLLCPNTLDGNRVTGEHIVLSAMGGRREVRAFICRPCNSERGSDWDAELASQFLFFSTTANVRRGRGGQHPDHKIKTTTGEPWKIRGDSVLVPQKPRVSIKDQGKRTEISVSAADMKTFRTLLAKVAKEHRNFDVTKALEQTKVEESYFDQTLHVQLEFGGALAGRSVVKSAMALLSEVDGVEKVHCERALQYLLNPEGMPPFGHCYYEDLVVARPTTHLFHCVSVVGQPEHRRILAYVEFFNCSRFLIHVGDGYDGEAFQRTYAIDPVNGTEFDLQVSFDAVGDRLEDTLKSAGEPNEKRIDVLTQ